MDEYIANFKKQWRWWLQFKKTKLYIKQKFYYKGEFIPYGCSSLSINGILLCFSISWRHCFQANFDYINKFFEGEKWDWISRHSNPINLPFFLYFVVLWLFPYFFLFPRLKVKKRLSGWKLVGLVLSMKSLRKNLLDYQAREGGSSIHVALYT